MRRPAGPLAALLAFACLLSAAAQTSPALPALAEPILAARDPGAARAFLSRTDLEGLRAGDPALFDRAFHAANELSDLASVLETHKEPETLREALGAREDFELLAKPGRLIAWAAQRLPGVDAGLVRAGVYDWGSLDAPLRASLARGAVTAEAWGRTPFAGRRAAVAGFAARGLAALKSRLPRSAAELKAVEARAEALRPWLTHDQRGEADAAVEDAQAARKGLADAAARVKASGDPRLKSLLAAAQSAPDPQTALARLAAVFDGLGVHNAAVDDAGPGSPEQRFTAKTRATLAEMLKGGALREMRGTVVGDELIAFYQRETLDLRVKPLAVGTLGEYDSKTKEMSINEREIEQWLRREGRTVQDLLGAGDAYNDLLRAVLPVVVHEAVHQQQDAWQRDHKLPDWGAQGAEVEAKGRESAFVLEKSRRDKGYAAFMAQNQKRFEFVRTAVSQSAVLARDPAAFRAEIMTDYYPGNAAVETDAAAAAAGEKAERADAPRVYAAYRARDERSWAQVTGVLRWLREHPQGEAPAAPPAPAAPGRRQ